RLALHHGGKPVFVCLLQSDPSPCSRRLITITHRPAIRGTGRYGISGRTHCGLMLAARKTLAHFSVSSAISLPKSAGESASTSPPRSASRALFLGSARAALTSLLSLSTTSAGVAFGAPTPYQVLAS